MLSCGNKKWYLDTMFTEKCDESGYESPSSVDIDWNIGCPSPYTNRRCFSRHSMYEFSSRGRGKRKGVQQESEAKKEGRSLAERRGKPVATVLSPNLKGEHEQDAHSLSPKERPRLSSMPNRTNVTHLPEKSQPKPPSSPNDPNKGECGVRRVRSFRITPKGVVRENPGNPKPQSRKDSFKRYTMRKQKGVAPLKVEKTRFKVMVLGGSGVGKKVLIHDFMVPDSHPFVSVSFGKFAVWYSPNQ